MKQQTVLNFQNETGALVDETPMWKQFGQILTSLPDQSKELLPGLSWGSAYQLYTPAFWKLQYLTNRFPENIEAHRLSENIRDEIVLCMLGGYGIPSEIGLLAFNKLKDEHLIRNQAALEDLLRVLSEPLRTESGRLVKYRFAKQKAQYIYAFLNREDIKQIPADDDLRLRAWLTSVKGIGYKTASWITRNWLRSERVAILDIHLLRAGVITGFFKRDFNLNTEYLDLEQRYLQFCMSLDVRPSDMDAVIWYYMKKNNKLALNILTSIT